MAGLRYFAAVASVVRYKIYTTSKVLEYYGMNSQKEELKFQRR